MVRKKRGTHTAEIRPCKAMSIVPLSGCFNSKNDNTVNLISNYNMTIEYKHSHDQVLSRAVVQTQILDSEFILSDFCLITLNR